MLQLRRVCDFCYSELNTGQGEQHQHGVQEEEDHQDKKKTPASHKGSAATKPNGLLTVAVPVPVPQAEEEGKLAAVRAVGAAPALAGPAATGEEDEDEEDVVTEICDNLEMNNQQVAG